MQKDKMKRVVIDLPIELSLKIKEISAKQNSSMKQWLIKAILMQLYKEKKLN